MANRLKAYVRRTIINSAREYAYPKSRRTAESTRAACIDAMRGTDTGWWHDMIYTSDIHAMARRYSYDIIKALNEYQDETGETYIYRPGYGEPDRSASDIAFGVACLKLSKKPSDQALDDASLGIRFAVEWYAGQVAQSLCPDI